MERAPLSPHNCSEWGKNSRTLHLFEVTRKSLFPADLICLKLILFMNCLFEETLAQWHTTLVPNSTAAEREKKST